MDFELEKKELETFNNGLEVKKEELRKKMCVLRSKSIKKIDYYQTKVNEQRRNLDEINKEMCETFGHTYSKWEEKPDKYLDRSWYYERYCEICGIKERTDIEPETYVTINHKTGKIYTHKR